MKVILNCDDVFETLTAGPVGQGSDEASELAGHFAECEACRQLADAFRPATHLIHEAMAEDERVGLPSYSPDDEFVSRVMSQIDVLPSIRLNEKKFHRASLGLCVVVTVLLLLLWSQTPAEHTGLAAAPVSLDSLGLPAACVEFTPESNHAAATTSRDDGEVHYVCCTSCHVSSRESSDLSKTRMSNMSQLIAACNSCH